MNSADKNQEREILAVVNAELDRGLETLDAGTLSRLKRIRAEAVARSGRDRRTGYLIPAGLAATACLVFAVMTFGPTRPATEPERIMEEFEMFSSSESLEFYEDLEFYEWLEENA